MSLNFGILPKMLFKPREAFSQLQATATDGIILIVLFSIISQGINFALGTAIELSTILSSISHIVAFIVIAWLVAALVKRLDKGTGDFGATLGLMGYTTFLAFIFLIIIDIIGLAGISVGVNAASLSGNPTALASAGIVAGIIGVVYFVWSLWLVSTAISVANKISTWNALGTYLLLAVIIGLIEGFVIVYTTLV